MSKVDTSVPIFQTDSKNPSKATDITPNITVDANQGDLLPDSRTAPLCDDEALRQKVKDYKLPVEVEAFLDEHGGIGNLMKAVIEFNPLVDVSMAYVLVIDWAHCELGLNDPELEKKVEDRIKILRDSIEHAVQDQD